MSRHWLIRDIHLCRNQALRHIQQHTTWAKQPHTFPADHALMTMRWLLLNSYMYYSVKPVALHPHQSRKTPAAMITFPSGFPHWEQLAWLPPPSLGVAPTTPAASCILEGLVVAIGLNTKRNEKKKERGKCRDQFEELDPCVISYPHCPFFWGYRYHYSSATEQWSRKQQQQNWCIRML